MSIMRHIKKISIILSVAGLVALCVPVLAFAQSSADVCRGVGVAAGAGGCDPAAGNRAINGVIGTVINILSAVVGVVGVIMIIIGGFKYVSSGGDASSVSSAKQTIIYALVGLAIAASAQVIARFVLGRAT